MNPSAECQNGAHQTDYKVIAMKPAHFTLTALLLYIFSGLGNADAAVIQVDADCSLRDAIRSANSDTSLGGCTAGFEDDLILIQPGVETLVTPAPSLALPDIVTTMTIQGISDRARIFAGYSTERIFEIHAADVTLRNLLIEEISDCTPGSTGFGAVEIRGVRADIEDVVFRKVRNCDGPGAVYSEDFNIAGARPEILNCVFEDNAAIAEAGKQGLNIWAEGEVTVRDSQFIDTGRCDGCSDIYSEDNLRIERSTFKPGPGSGVHRPFFRPSDVSAITRIENSTFSDLTQRSSRVDLVGRVLIWHATLAGVDLFVEDGELSLYNTIVDGECSFPGTFVEESGNWYTTDSCFQPVTPGNLFLQLLDDRGGPTPTHGLHWLSDAIGAGDFDQCEELDQTVKPRLGDDLCDIGAYERFDIADIEISVDLLTPPPHYSGQPLEFEIGVNNLGPGVVDVFRVNLLLGFVPTITIQSINGICTTNPCDVDFLLPTHGTQSFTVHAIANDTNTEFELQGFAIDISPNWLDPDTTNNIAQAGGDLVPVADLSINKTLLTSAPYTLGQSLSYVVEIVNHGPDDATSVVFEDTPDGLDITSISNCAGPAQGPCSFATLSPGQSELLTVTTEITDTLFDNVATVTADQYDPDSQNSIDDEFNGGSTQKEADLQVELDLQTPAPHYFGQIVEYGVRVGNFGGDKATGVEMLFDAPGLLLLGVSGPCSFVPCDLGNIPADDGAIVTILGQVLSEQAIPVTATVTGFETDPVLANNTATQSLPSQAAADIELSLTPISQPPYAQGVAIEYELGVINLGFSAASDISIDIASQNLDIQQVIGERCIELPCTISNFGLQTEFIDILAVPISPGPFDLSASATASEFDPEPLDNIDDTDNGGIAGINPADFLFKDSFEVFAVDK